MLGELIRDPQPLRLDDVGRHPRSYGFPIGHPPMSTFLGVPIVIDGVAFGNLYLAEKRSGPFDEADEDAVITLAGWAAVAIANARVHESVAGRRDKLEQTVAALSAMIDIALALGGETDIDAMLELVVKRSRALVSANAMAVALLEGGVLVVAAVAGALGDDRRRVRIPVAGSALEEAVRSRRALPLGEAGVHAVLGRADTTPSARAGLVVPLLFRERAGRAGGHRPAGRRPAVHGGRRAAPAGVLDHGRRGAGHCPHRGRRSVAATPRGRGGRAQPLGTRAPRRHAAGAPMLRMTLSGARRKGDAASLVDAVTLSLEHIDGQIASLRGLIAELRPTALDDVGLGAALEAFVERAASLGGTIELTADLDYEAGRNAARHTPELEATLYRIAQEGISNAIKHADASVVRVTVRDLPDEVEVLVEDDGGGFDTGKGSSGYGLIGMRERAELLGGVVEVTSVPGAGTRVLARLALHAAPRGVRAGRRLTTRRPRSSVPVTRRRGRAPGAGSAARTGRARPAS